jgi:hypothetical protein
VFRKIDADPPPTLLLDEVDAIFNPKNGNTEGLRALLNAGNRPGTKVPRCVGPSQKLTDFSVFCPKALAGIRDLPDTVADRAIPIRLKRRAPHEPVERFRRREAEEAADALYEWLRSWGERHVPVLAEARPDLPDEIDDRAWDFWEPLFAIADLAKGDWSQKARAAAIALSGSETRDDSSAGVRLLADVRAIFGRRGTDRIASTALVADLHEIEEAPWGEWYGKPITTHGVAKLLSPFDIRPRTVRLDDETTARGYRLDQLEEAFARYLPVSNRNNNTTQQPCGFAATSEASHVTEENSLDPASINGCVGVSVCGAEEAATGDEEAILREVAELVDEGVLVPLEQPELDLATAPLDVIRRAYEDAE